MAKKFLFIIPFFSLLIPHTTHTVNILDMLNHFLHSTAPKIDSNTYAQATTAQEREAIIKNHYDNIVKHTAVGAFLTACVFSYVMHSSRSR